MVEKKRGGNVGKRATAKFGKNDHKNTEGDKQCRNDEIEHKKLDEFFHKISFQM